MSEELSRSQYRRIEAQGGNALEMALSEIKALKAENEALKKQRDDEAWFHDDEDAGTDRRRYPGGREE